jgi:hypothetical protein
MTKFSGAATVTATPEKSETAVRMVNPQNLESEKSDGTTGDLVQYLSERKQGEEPHETDGEEEARHPADAGLLVAPRRVPRRGRPRQLIRLLVQPQQEGPEPACRCRVGGQITVRRSSTYGGLDRCAI